MGTVLTALTQSSVPLQGLRKGLKLLVLLGFTQWAVQRRTPVRTSEMNNTHGFTANVIHSKETQLKQHIQMQFS